MHLSCKRMIYFLYNVDPAQITKYVKLFIHLHRSQNDHYTIQWWTCMEKGKSFFCVEDTVHISILDKLCCSNLGINFIVLIGVVHILFYLSFLFFANWSNVENLDSYICMSCQLENQKESSLLDLLSSDLACTYHNSINPRLIIYIDSWFC